MFKQLTVIQERFVDEFLDVLVKMLIWFGINFQLQNFFLVWKNNKRMHTV